MNLPKQRIVRALVRRGMLDEKDVPKFLYALNRDKETQQQFLKVWREGRGGRWSRIRDLALWFWERRDIIMRIISIALLFADKAPEEPKRAEQRKPEEKSLVKGKIEKDEVQEPQPYDLGLQSDSKVTDVSDELQD